MSELLTSAEYHVTTKRPSARPVMEGALCVLQVVVLMMKSLPTGVPSALYIRPRTSPPVVWSSYEFHVTTNRPSARAVMEGPPLLVRCRGVDNEVAADERQVCHHPPLPQSPCAPTTTARVPSRISQCVHGRIFSARDRVKAHGSERLATQPGHSPARPCARRRARRARPGDARSRTAASST
jgi:hypothetical protein